MGRFTKKETTAIDLMLDIQRCLNFEMDAEEKTKFKVYWDFFTDRLYPEKEGNWRGMIV